MSTLTSVRHVLVFAAFITGPGIGFAPMRGGRKVYVGGGIGHAYTFRRRNRARQTYFLFCYRFALRT